jgi:hypothetical protein
MTRAEAREIFFEQSAETLNELNLSSQEMEPMAPEAIRMLINSHLEDMEHGFRAARYSSEPVKLWALTSDTSGWRHGVEDYARQYALHEFLAHHNLLNEFYERPDFSPFEDESAMAEESDRDIWCVDISPRGSRIGLYIKYAPGIEDETGQPSGWELALFAFRR